MNSAHSREVLVDSRSTNENLAKDLERSTTSINEGTVLVTNETARTPSVWLVDGSTLRAESKNKMTTKGFHERRLVNKSGELKVLAKNVPRKTRLYLTDIFTTMVNLRWKWVILIFVTSYIFSWVLFGFIWWLIAILRGSSTCVLKVC